MKRDSLTLPALLALLFLALTCKKEPPPAVQVPALQLVAEDASCTEAWLRIRSLQVPATVQLVQVAPTLQTRRTLRLTSSDTLIVDEGLLPRRTYTYQAQLLEPQTPNLITSTPDVQLTTMDTTSHNFTFQIDTLGDGSSSVLYDVAIINDTLAYAVGEIYKRDSLGNWDPLPYNAAKWNGRRWELLRVPAYFQGSTWYLPLRCITAFGPDDIWFEAGIHWDGTRYNTVPYTINYPARINRSWGTSSRDFYVVGDGGLIAHYDGLGWRRIESGTGLDVYDIYGQKNQRTGETEIYGVAAKQFVTFDRRILRITSSGVTTVSDSTIPYSLHGVWFKVGGPYYVVGSGMYRKHDPTKPGPWQWLHTGITPYYIYATRGNDVNDIFFCGSYGELLHFNGTNFRSYQSTAGFSALEFYQISCRGNLIVAVGYLQPRAVAVIGRRT